MELDNFLEMKVMPTLRALGYTEERVELVRKDDSLLSKHLSHEGFIYSGDRFLLTKLKEEQVGIFLLTEGSPNKLSDKEISDQIEKHYFSEWYNKMLYDLHDLHDVHVVFLGVIVYYDLEHHVWRNCLITGTGQPKVCNLQDLHISNFVTTIEDLQWHSFNYLYEKHQEDETFTFDLRVHNRANRLEEGYFFLGNEHYCAISFWTGGDWKNKTPSIYLDLQVDGDIRLVLTAKDSEQKAQFLEKVADLVGATQRKQKGEARPVWIKTYVQNWEKEYVEVLEEFLRQDKEIIDAQIFKAERRKDPNLGDIGFVPLEKFEGYLERILPIRDRLAQERGTPTQKTSEAADTAPIQLRNITLRNIAMFESFTMDLKARVLCIIGDNGTGKTSLLKAIILGLVGANESTEIDPEQPKYKELQELLRITGLDEYGNTTYAGDGAITLHYNRKEAYTNKIVLEQQEHSLDVVLKDDLSEQHAAALVDSNYFTHLVIAFTQGGYTRNYKFRAYEKQRGNMSDVNALLFDARENHFHKLEEWIFELDGDSEPGNRAQQVLKFVFEVVSGVVGLDVVLERIEHQRQEIWVQIGEDKPILFKLISQGFTKVFTWIGHFVRRLSETNPDREDFKNAPAILLIDEIDTYLHPKWQRNILAFLAETFIKTQFIVTTHSPLVANYLNTREIKGGVALYRLDKGAAQPKEFKKSYGRDLTSIFHDWMGIADRPKEVTHLIHKLFKNIDKETKDSLEEASQQILQLKQWLEPTDEIIVEAETYYNLALESVEE